MTRTSGQVLPEGEEPRATPRIMSLCASSPSLWSMRTEPPNDPGVPLLRAGGLPPASARDGAWIRAALYGWLASSDSQHTRDAAPRSGPSRRPID